MRADRLLKLADFLETVPRKAFNISDWQTAAPTKPEGATQGECGFAGCAVGWAAHTGLFPGLELRRYGGWTEITYSGESSFRAASKLFEIDETLKTGRVLPPNAEYLFASWMYPKHPVTPKQVAARIRKFVKATSSPPSGGEAVSGSKTSSPGRE